MGNMKCTKRPNIIFVPYPAQGHVTPMFLLASAFQNRGFDSVLVTPEYIHNQFVSRMESEVLCMPIPDGLDKDTTRDFFSIEKAMENNMSVHLERIIQKLDEDGGKVVCLVVDLLASWAIGVANRCRVPAAGFWPAMFSTYQLIADIPDMVRTGLISDQGIPQHGKVCSIPNQPVLSTEDIPWLSGTLAATKARFKFWNRTLDRTRTLRWLLVNTFPDELVDGKTQLTKSSSQEHSPLVFPVGPLNKHAMTKRPSFWEEDKSSLDWLDKQKPNSVVYVSFGSWVSPIGEEKVKNLALSLEASGRPFLWALQSTWRDGLPVGYLDRVSMQGKVVLWAPQMEVLQHKAVGCYLTHCGWNSTMEALQCQKPLLCYPVSGDHFVTNNYIVQVFKIGVKLNGFGQKDVAEGLRKVMEDSEMKNRIRRLNERTMGQEAYSRIMSTLTAFIDDVKKIRLDDQTSITN